MMCALQSTLLRLLVKRRGNYLRFHALSPNFHSDRLSDRSVLWRYVCQSNIFFQIRSIRAAGDVSDFGTAVAQHLVAVASNAALNDFQPHERSLQSFAASTFESLATNKFRLLHF